MTPAVMGAAAARVHSANDFELVVRSAKELEHVLEAEFGATGKGVHEKARRRGVADRGVAMMMN